MNQAMLDRIKSDYPKFRVIPGERFSFRPPKTIVYETDTESFELLLLHELGHALLGHRFFAIDVERLKMEAAAWEKAKELAHNYGVAIDEELIQTELDTYRDWLHQKSRCPKCGLTRYQTPDSRYHCPSCEAFNSNKK